MYSHQRVFTYVRRWEWSPYLIAFLADEGGLELSLEEVHHDRVVPHLVHPPRLSCYLSTVVDMTTVRETKYKTSHMHAHANFWTCMTYTCTMYMYIDLCVCIHVLWWNPLFKILRNKDTSINRTHLAVLNTLFVYITTPVIRTPH